MTLSISTIKFDARGLVPVVAQDAESGEVLMLAYANQEALERTLQTGQAHYWSRSRNELWRKGATSGHTQTLTELRYDCDGDAVLYRVKQTGPACHTGERSCFYRTVDTVGEEAKTPSLGALAGLEHIINQRLKDLPEGSYVASLHHKGLGRVAQKVVEEAGESIVAALEGKNDELVGEAADLLFHLMVMLRECGVGLGDVVGEMEARHQSKTNGKTYPPA